MDYAEGRAARNKGLSGLIVENLLNSEMGIGQSFSKALSDRTKATFTGIKEAFDPLNIAKKLTGGSRLAPALLGRLTGRNSSSIQYFSGRKKTAAAGVNFETGESIGPTPTVQTLGFIFEELIKADEIKKKQMEDFYSYENKREKDELDRTEALIQALTGRQVKKEKKEYIRDEKGRFAKKPNQGKVETPTTPKTPAKETPKAPAKETPKAPAKETPKAPASTATKATKAPIIPSVGGAAKAAVVIAGTALFSAAAMATIKSEQGIRSEADALAPNNDKKRVAKGEFPDTQTPKLGAATPDTQNSTSYGLFGINNIRRKGKSSLDAFIEQNPQLGLPDPGDPKDPAQVKIFNDAWWNLAKTRPQDLLEAQAKFFKRNIESVATKGLSNLPPEIANNPGVQAYMIDRQAQFGGVMLDSALRYASGAKTPQEFINLMSEHDRNNLRQIFKNTSDADFQRLEKGLFHRIKDRTDTATAMSVSNVNTPVTDNPTGAKVDASSKENKDLKKSLNDAPAPTTVNSTTVNTSKSSSQKQDEQKEDDRPAYLRKRRG
jgi:hypothetical protein